MPVLLFHGDNVLEIDEAVREVRGRFQPADVLSLDGATVPLTTLSEACLTAGLFDPERLVIVHNLHNRTKGVRKETGETAELAALLQSVPSTTTLLVIGKEMPADHRLVSDVRRADGDVRAFSTPRKGDLPRWVIGRGRSLGATVEPAAAELLADLVGANALLLATELEKLITYAGDERRITLPMVETLVGAVTQDSIFTLVDSIAAGDQARALRQLHAQLDRASSNPIDFALYLIRMLARQMRILLRIRLQRAAGRSVVQITSDLKLPRYYADRYFRQAGRLSREQLQGSFERLAALEFALKSGKVEPTAGLDLLVADLCS